MAEGTDGIQSFKFRYNVHYICTCTLICTLYLFQIQISKCYNIADGISVRMMSSDVLRDVWVALFNECWVSGMVPNLWRKGACAKVS